MNKDLSKYFSINDIIKTAIEKNFNSKKKDSTEISLSLINDMTYNNIWQTFVKWCNEQAELGYVLNVFPIGNFVMIKEKSINVLSLKLSEAFLKENQLRLDETKFDKNVEVKQTSKNMVQKLNILALASELNLPKRFIQSGLKNLFSSIAFLLESNPNCVIEMGSLGNLYSNNRFVYHMPMKIKNDNYFIKKKTVKSLLGKYKEEMTTKDQMDPVTKFNVNQSVNLNNYNNDIKNYTKFQSSKDLSGGEPKAIFDSDQSIIKKNNRKIPQLIIHSRKDDTTTASSMILLPMNETDWSIKDMLSSTFKINDSTKSSSYPVLFNEYSNTRAAPFTSEKTQIPISHRIGSFYSLSLQNFIVDKTTKSVKTLYDEYFFKYKNILLDILPATQQEEYMNLISSENNNKNERVNQRKETYKRYQNLYVNFIPDHYIAEIKDKWLLNIVRLCLRAYNINDQSNYDKLLNECIKEIMENYNTSIKKAILDYILKHPEQKHRFKIPSSFRTIPEYGNCCISRKSDDNWDWKRAYNLSKVRISNNLMVMGLNITKILKYFKKNISARRYLDVPKGWDTEKLLVFIENQKAKIEEHKKLVAEDWKKSIETILKENKIFKDQLIIYFKSVAGVMSTQLRQIIVNTVQDFHQFISIFKKKQYYDPHTVFSNQFKPSFPFQNSFLELDILTLGDAFDFSETLSEIHNKINSLVNEVIKSSQDVERPDNIFIKNIDKKNSLWEVQQNDQEISRMINDIDNIVKDNLDVINKVLDIYEPYRFVLKEDYVIESYKKDPPKREDIKKKIRFYEEKLKHLRENMPNSIYMNLIRIDCTKINKQLRDNLSNFINEQLKYILTYNINYKSKFLIDDIEKLKERLADNPTTEESLAKLDLECDLHRNETIPKLKADYRDFLDWLFFYFEFDIYPIFPETKTTESINSIENTIKNTNLTISYVDHALEEFENRLKEKRNEFDKNLYKQRLFLNDVITQLKKDTDSIKETAADMISAGDEALLQVLEELQKKLNDASTQLAILVKKEEYLGTFPQEEERIDNCKKELEPLINYVSFIVEFKNKSNYDNTDIKAIPFYILVQLLEKSNDIFENSTPKLSMLKSNINGFKKNFENFRCGVELGKSIFNLIEVVIKFESISNTEATKTLLEENNIYCRELTKIIFDNDKGQDFLKNLKLKDVKTHDIKERYAKNKVEIENIINEWEMVKNIFDIISKIAIECDINFHIEKLKDKQYSIVSHNCYQEIKNVLNKNIHFLDENMKTGENFKYSNQTVIKRKGFRLNLQDLKDIIEKMNENQLVLEKNIARAILLQKKSDLFFKLKQAENTFKIIIDHIEKYPKLMDVLKVKDSFKENLNHIAVFLSEIPERVEDDI